MFAGSGSPPRIARGCPMAYHYTPPEIAKVYHVAPDKVLTWIRSGELPAFNAATRPNGRPRYLINEADLKTFEARRAVVPVTKIPRRRRPKQEGVTEFFK